MAAKLLEKRFGIKDVSYYPSHFLNNQNSS